MGKKKKNIENAEKEFWFTFWLCNPEIQKVIKGESKYKIMGMEANDIIQEIELHLLNKFNTSDSLRALSEGLLKTIIRNKRIDLHRGTIKDMIKDENGEYKPRTITATEFGSKIEESTGEEINLYENLSEDARLNKETKQFTENLIKGFDIEEAIKKAGISKEENELLKLAKEYPLRETEEKIGKPKTTTDRKLKGIGKKLEKYLSEYIKPLKSGTNSYRNRINK